MHAEASAEQLEAQAIEVTVAGRMMAKRVMGKASFATIADPSGSIQLFLQAATLPDVLRRIQDLGRGRHRWAPRARCSARARANCR